MKKFKVELMFIGEVIVPANSPGESTQLAMGLALATCGLRTNPCAIQLVDELEIPEEEEIAHLPFPGDWTTVGVTEVDTDESQEYLDRNKSEWRARAISNVETLIRSGTVDDEEVVVRDTVTNLMHWCKDKGIDFTNELRVANINFDAELEGTP